MVSESQRNAANQTAIFLKSSSLPSLFAKLPLALRIMVIQHGIPKMSLLTISANCLKPSSLQKLVIALGSISQIRRKTSVR